MAIHTCRICSATFEVNRRGRPPVLCESCKSGKPKSGKTEVKPVDIKTALTDALTEAIFDEPPSDYLPEVLKDSGVDFNAEISYLRGESSDPFESAETPGEYVVTVGNGLGVVYSGPDKSKASAKYREYVSKSEMGYGQVGFEKVTLTYQGKVLCYEHPRPFETSIFSATEL